MASLLGGKQRKRSSSSSAAAAAAGGATSPGAHAAAPPLHFASRETSPDRIARSPHPHPYPHPYPHPPQLAQMPHHSNDHSQQPPRASPSPSPPRESTFARSRSQPPPMLSAPGPAATISSSRPQPVLSLVGAPSATRPALPRGSGLASGLQLKAESLDCLNLDFESNGEGPEHSWAAMPKCDAFVGPGRAKHTAVAWGDGVFIHGGDNGRRRMLNDLLRFDTREFSWSTVAIKGQAPSPRYHHSGVVYQNTMFIFGGYTGDIHSNLNLENRNDLYRCRLDKCMWQEVHVMPDSPKPVPRSAHGAVVYGKHMYVFAGFDGQDRLNDMWRISVEESADPPRWEQIHQQGDNPPTCCNCPCVVAGDCMYVFSGSSGVETTNTLFCFSFRTQTWRRVRPRHVLQGGELPPVARFGHTLVHFEGCLYVFGGATDKLSSTLYRFDLETLSWSAVKPAESSEVPCGRCFHSACVVGASMFVFGGKSEQENSSEMHRFRLTTTPRCTLQDDLLGVLESGDLVDLAFEVGPADSPTQLLAHSAIVAARSRYLLDRILDARQQAQETGAGRGAEAGAMGDDGSTAITTITIPAAEPEAFHAVLRYLYSDQLPDRCLAESLDATSLQLLLDIYDVSRLLQMPRLERQCIDCFRMSVNPQNVLSCLRAVSDGRRSHLAAIQDYLLTYCTKESVYQTILMSTEFEDLEQSLMVQIVRKRELLKNQPRVGSRFPLGESKWPNSGEGSLASDMELFLYGESGRAFQDVELQLADDVFVPAHRVILASRCAYFRGMFTSNMIESRARSVPIRIGDLVPPPEAFQSFLNYLYFGETRMRPEHSLYLFAATHFYNLTNNRLQAVCKTNLEQNVSSSNVFPILEAADSIQALEMKKRALDIIVRNFVKVSRLPRMQDLKRHLLLDILQAISEHLQHTELHLGTNLFQHLSSSTV